MARINIEDKWWSDPRRMLLTQKLGYGLADGVFLNAVRLSQNFNGESFDATKLFPKEWILALIDTGLASGSAEIFYVSGSKEHHQWIVQQREHGKRGGKSTSNKYSNLAQANPQPTPSQPPANPRPSSSSSSSSSSSISKIHNTNTLAQKLATRPKALVADKYSGFGEVFKKEWTARYKIPIPQWNAKRASMIKNWAKSVGIENIESYIKLFMAWNEPWVVKAGHPPEIMVSKTNSFVTDFQNKRGKIVAEQSYKTNEDKISKEIKSKTLLEELQEHEQKLQQEPARRVTEAIKSISNSA